MKKFGYTKSRNGCQRCKKRRVKCDEKRPCSACKKHGIPCSLEDSVLQDTPAGAPDYHSDTHLSRPDPASSSASRASPYTHTSDIPSHGAFSPLLAPGSGSPTDDSVSRENALIDLELMHHYTSRAYGEFPNVEYCREFFQQEVPRLALRYDFLLHQCLAVAAFHLMHISENPLGPQYLRRATYHVESSLRGLREALYEGMKGEGAVALFVASSFVMPTTCASRRFTDPGKEGDDDPLQDMQRIVGLFRGIKAVGITASASLGKDMVPQIFGKAFNGPVEEDPGWFPGYINGLEALESYIGMRCDLNEHHRHAAVKGLRVLVDIAIPSSDDYRRRILLNPAEIRIVLRFPFLVQDDFLEVLRARYPPAMAAFLYYCAVMYLAEPSCWFLVGWASRQARSIERDLRGTPWREQVRWPIQVLQLE